MGKSFASRAKAGIARRMTRDDPSKLEIPSQAPLSAPSKPQSTPMAGGVFIALFIVLGVIIGGLRGQPSIGFLTGLSVGIILAVLLWLIDRAKGRP